MDNKELKRELILNASEDIKKFIFDTTGEEVDELDIAELINTNLGFIFNVISEITDGNESKSISF